MAEPTSPVDAIRQERERETTRPRPRAATPRVTQFGKTAQANLQRRLQEFFAVVGLGVSTLNEADGRVIVEGAPRLAEAYAQLAAENATVRRVLEGLMAGGAWSGAILATASVALPIAKNHGLSVPLPGMPPAAATPRRGETPSPDSPRRPTPGKDRPPNPTESAAPRSGVPGDE